MARAKMKQTELARAAGTHKQQINKLANGERQLTVRWAKRLAPLLGFTWQELIEGPRSTADTRRSEVFLTYDSLNDEHKRMALTMLKTLALQQATDAVEADISPPEPKPPAKRPVKPRPRGGDPPSRPTQGGSGRKNPGRKDHNGSAMLAPDGD